MLDESELVDSLSNKEPRTHKAILISQVFNPETADLETFVEHCKRAETTDDITLKPILKPSQKAPLILILKKEMSHTHYKRSMNACLVVI